MTRSWQGCFVRGGEGGREIERRREGGREREGRRERRGGGEREREGISELGLFWDILYINNFTFDCHQLQNVNLFIVPRCIIIFIFMIIISV